MPITPDDEIDTGDELLPPEQPSTLSDAIRENPLASVIAAFVTGVIVSRFL
jgi:hypothetical protein